MNNLDLVQQYFELSNKADLENIEKILANNIVYSSDNVGVHFGQKDVMNMKKDFFGKFISLNWEVENINEKKSNIFVIDFILKAQLIDSTSIAKPGRETVIVKDGQIHFIQVKNT